MGMIIRAILGGFVEIVQRISIVTIRSEGRGIVWNDALKVVILGGGAEIIRWIIMEVAILGGGVEIAR